MAIIKNLAFYQKNALKDLKTLVGNEKFVANFLPFPLDFFNHILPLRLKFYQEAFVALDNDKIQGLVALEKEPDNFQKLKITKLFLKENSNDVGEQLINYVISRYCAYGASSFCVILSEKFEELVNLFVNQCAFRITSVEYWYKITSDGLKNKNYTASCFKNFENCNAQEVCELYNSQINSHQKPFFEKRPKYFRENFSTGLKASFKYVFKDNEKDKIYGYFSISTIDNKNYVLDFIVNQAFDAYLPDILNFCIHQIKKRNSDSHLYVKVKNYFSNSKNIIKQLENLDFSLENKNLILTKDYLRPIKEKGLTNRILFNDTSIQGV